MPYNNIVENISDDVKYNYWRQAVTNDDDDDDNDVDENEQKNWSK